MSCVLATSVSVNNTPHRVWVGTLCIVWLWCGIYVLCWYWWTFCGWRSTWYESTSTRHTIIMNNTFHSQSTATLRNIVSVGSRYFLVAVEPISCTHTRTVAHSRFQYLLSIQMLHWWCANIRHTHTLAHQWYRFSHWRLSLLQRSQVQVSLVAAYAMIRCTYIVHLCYA